MSAVSGLASRTVSAVGAFAAAGDFGSQRRLRVLAVAGFAVAAVAFV
jgi:hypothetical protein